MKQAVYLRNSH